VLCAAHALAVQSEVRRGIGFQSSPLPNPAKVMKLCASDSVSHIAS
jgi:hypothetical protein